MFPRSQDDHELHTLFPTAQELFESRGGRSGLRSLISLVVFKALKHKHIKPLLQKLHWLPVVSRIQYKVATLCYSSFTESYPVYLSELLTVYRPSRQLRSISDTRTFRIPFTKSKTFGQRAFSFTGPTQWNSLPYDVRHSVSTSSFKQALKTHLFKSAYN